MTNTKPEALTEANNIDDIETEYKRIFSNPSPLGNTVPERVDYGPDASYEPITEEEIANTIKSTSSSAPGPDGYTVQMMKRAPVYLIICLLNAIMFTGYIPDSGKACRTTLIPKKGDPRNINNWRPLTVTSLLLRLLNIILAKRLGALNCAQKGFRSIDGCMTNVLLLQTIIKSCRKKASPYSIVTMDFKKAFEIVSSYSIPRALHRIGIHTKTINIIQVAYKDCTITVTCNKNTTGPINMTRGVKKGDPLSPVIFTFVMDELLHRVDHSYGIEIGGTRVAIAAYADDLLIMGPTIDDTQITIDHVSRFLKERNLSLNIPKCTALTMVRVPKKKKLCCLSVSAYFVDNTPIPAITVDNQFCYLGSNFDFAGMEKLDIKILSSTMDALSRCPLKPFQKMAMLNRYLIPKFLHDMQYFGITSATKEVMF